MVTSIQTQCNCHPASTVPPTGPSDPSTDVPMAGGRLCICIVYLNNDDASISSQIVYHWKRDAEVMF